MSSKNNLKSLSLIYIMGLSHSGSTLLDLLLSRHPDLVGLGEISAFIYSKKTNLEGTVEICSCGESMSECPFWKELQDIRKAGKHDKKYRQVLEQVRNYGASGLIDSSKNMEPLLDILPLAEGGTFDLSVVYLARDARGWAHSMARIDRRWGKYRPMFYYLYLWYRNNLDLLRRLKRTGTPFLSVSYERLCFETGAVLREVFAFSNIPPGELGPANTHVAYANRMKLSVSEVPKVRYDSAWKKNRSVRISLLLLPFIALLNKKLTGGFRRV